MIKYTCIHKIRDGKGNIVGYKLKDESGRIIQVSSRDLKNQISNGKVQVENLTLTSDGRLVDAAEEKEKQAKQVNDIDRKILNYIEACKIIGIKPLTIEKMGEDYVIVGLPSNERNIQIPEFATAIRLNTKLSDNNGDNQYINKFTSFEIERILRELLNRLYKNDENQITIEDIQKILSDEHKEIKELINEKSVDTNKLIDENIEKLTKSLEELEKDIIDEIDTNNDKTLKEIIEFMKSGDAQVAIKKAEELEPKLIGAMENMLKNEDAYLATKSRVLPEDLNKKLDGNTYELYKTALDNEDRYNSIRSRYTVCSHIDKCRKGVVTVDNKLSCEHTGNCVLKNKVYQPVNIGCEVNIDKQDELKQYINYTCNYFYDLYNTLTKEYNIREDVNMQSMQIYLDAFTAIAGYGLGLAVFGSNIFLTTTSIVDGLAASGKALTADNILSADSKNLAQYGRYAGGITGIIGGALGVGKVSDKLGDRRLKYARAMRAFDKSMENLKNMHNELSTYTDLDIYRFTLEYIYSESKTFSSQVGKRDKDLVIDLDKRPKIRKVDRGLLHKEILKTIISLKSDKVMTSDIKLNVVVAYLAAYIYVKRNFNFIDNITHEHLITMVSNGEYKDDDELFLRHKILTIIVREYMVYNLHIMGIKSDIIYDRVLRYFNTACNNCGMTITTDTPSRVGIDINNKEVKVLELINEKHIVR